MSLERLEPVPIESLPVLDPVLLLSEALPEPVEPVVSLEAEPLPVPPTEPELEPVELLLESSVVFELEELGELVVSELVEPDPVPYFELEDPVSGAVAPGDVELLPPIRSPLVWPDVEEPPVVPDCARAGVAATSNPAMPRPATVPHPKYFMRTPSVPGLRESEARRRGRGPYVLASIR